MGVARVWSRRGEVGELCELGEVQEGVVKVNFILLNVLHVYK